MNPTFKSHWRLAAWQVIGEVHKSLSHDTSLKDRMKAIDAAYPFGPRQYHPYKMWLIERRNYLSQYGYRSKAKPKNGTHVVAGEICESPLERLMRRGAEQ